MMAGNTGGEQHGSYNQKQAFHHLLCSKAQRYHHTGTIMFSFMLRRAARQLQSLNPHQRSPLNARYAPRIAYGHAGKWHGRHQVSPERCGPRTLPGCSGGEDEKSCCLRWRGVADRYVKRSSGIPADVSIVLDRPHYQQQLPRPRASTA